MSIHVVIKCDLDWFGFPCRGAITVPADREANVYAKEHGWTPVLGTTAHHYCPAHVLALETVKTECGLPADVQPCSTDSCGWPVCREKESA